MNNHNKCACGSNSVSYRPIKNKNGYAKSLHRICQNCGKDLTAISLRKRASTLKRNLSSRNSNRGIKNTYRRNRLVPGMIATLAIAVVSSFGFTALANSEGLKNEVTYQAPQISTSTPPSVPETKPEPVESIKEKILRYSLKYDVNPKEIENIVKCETGSEDVNKASTTIQSRYLIGTPRRELSFGVAQIHISAHGITREQAYDVDYSLDFLANHWSKGHRGMWMNCSLKYHYI